MLLATLAVTDSAPMTVTSHTVMSQSAKAPSAKLRFATVDHLMGVLMSADLNHNYLLTGMQHQNVGVLGQARA